MLNYFLAQGVELTQHLAYISEYCSHPVGASTQHVIDHTAALAAAVLDHNSRAFALPDWAFEGVSAFCNM